MIRHKAISYALLVAISLILGSIGFMTAGCKSQSKIQVIEPQSVVTNYVPAKAFNDERYVWENFYFSTNEVKDTNLK